MYVVTVDFHIKTARIESFLPLILENARISRERETGCRQFDVCISEDDPEHVFLYEIYDDRTAFESHLASAHYRAFGAATEEMIASRDIRVFQRCY